MEILILGLLTILLPFNIYWWLRSNSIFWWCWAWLLRVCSVLFHHLLVHSVALILTMGNISSHQVVMLLNQAKWVWRWSTMHHIFLICKTLSIWTCWSFLCCPRPQTIASIALIWSDATCTSSFICFLWSMSSSCNLSSTNHLAWTWLHSSAMVVVHFIFKWSCSYWSTCLEDSKLLV